MNPQRDDIEWMLNKEEILLRIYVYGLYKCRRVDLFVQKKGIWPFILAQYRQEIKTKCSSDFKMLSYANICIARFSILHISSYIIICKKKKCTNVK